MSDTCLRIYFTNFVDLDILAGSDVSSEQTAFPVTNAYNQQRRSKVWRSDGYFNVTSSNNQIVLRETVGGDLVASIATGEYTTRTSFIAAVKTALDDAGASTYTVTNSSGTGFRFNIVSNGSGGGGVFHLMLTDSDFTAASLLGFDTTIDLVDSSLTRAADFLRINSSEWIEWDMGVSTNPRGFAAIGPRNMPLKLSPGGVYKIQANHTSNWTSPAYEEVLTYNDNALYITNQLGLADQGYRFWRFLIEDQNPDGFVEVGAFMLGDYFSPDRGRAQFPLQVQLVDRTETLFSEGGQSYADIKPKTAEYNLTWLGLKKADIEEIEDEFGRYGTGVPFICALDSGAVFSTSSQRRLLITKFADEPQYQLISPNNFTVTMRLREEL
jgi:hypothetical protein